MASTKNGVEHYAIGTATVKVAFANAQICCRNNTESIFKRLMDSTFTAAQRECLNCIYEGEEI